MAVQSMTRDDDQQGVSDALSKRLREGLGVLLIVVAVLAGIALFGHDANDPSLNNAAGRPSTNPLGFFGASIADIGYQSFGWAAWLPVLILPVWGLKMVFGRGLAWPAVAYTALPISLLASAAWLAIREIPSTWPYYVGLGGFVGDFIMQRLEYTLGRESYAVAAALTALLASVLALGISPGEVWSTFSRRGRREAPPLVPATVRPRFDQALDERLGGPVPTRPGGAAQRGGVGSMVGGIGSWFAGLMPSRPARRTFRPGPPPPPDATPAARRRTPPQPNPAERETPWEEDTLDLGGAEASPPPPPRPKKAASRPSVPPQAAEPEELVPDQRFQLPPLKFLAEARGREKVTLDREQLTETAQALEKVLDDFGVRGEIVDVRPGPVVTLYELEPAPGTRAARVISLADDIARSLSAMSVRVSTVPGRNVIGIELPNDARETVYLKDLLSSPGYEDTAAKLALALGKDIGGEPVVVDLSRMPHLLIAGTTGSGKSVAINAMLLSLLYRLPPEQCRLILIDPKVIELSVYEDIPHLLAPVVTEPQKAVVSLKWVVREMDERYRLMSHLGVRDITSYNRRMADAIGRGEQLSRRVQTGFEPGTGVPIFEQQPIEMRQMPLIVVIVDEVADLMLTAGKEIEGAIQRLSQKARAAGIHLIVATQRPSVDVLTGVIKANLPSRISFRVSSKIDSRTILGEPGAEQLLGQGDMLYMMPAERIRRVHGPLVTEEEVERVVSHLRKQGQPDYIDAITDEAALDAGNGFAAGGEGAGGEEGQYQQALQIVAKEGKASTSFLQRKMRIGYNSAARLIERMESEGVISHPDHVGRRRILAGSADATQVGDGPPW